ncbi:MAG: phytanoyl-CoA dioxygenase family protein, partial [Parvibaculaceae bacterium]
MPKLETLPATASPDEILAVLKRDGALILKDVLTKDQITQVLTETMPYIDATEPGRDDFTGRKTTRTGALVARSAACRDMVANKTIVAAAESFLKPFCERIQLHLTQVIRIQPGQPKQQIHRDRWAWGTYLKNLEPQFNTIWAITDFTKENGATQVCPGSLDWADDYQPTDDQIGYAEMKAGSVLVYSGGVFHGGGANVSNGDRIGINI